MRNCRLRWRSSCGGKGHEAASLGEMGLRDADDADIWERARMDGAIIVTKDEDFALMVAANDDAPGCFGCAREICSSVSCWRASMRRGRRSKGTSYPRLGWLRFADDQTPPHLFHQRRQRVSPLMRELRYLEKLIDELAKGRPMEKILRAA